MICFRKPGAAIQGGGQDAGDGGFADAAVAAEDVAVCGASLGDGILQGAGDVLLSDDLGELLRTIFARQDGVGHARRTIIRDCGARVGVKMGVIFGACTRRVRRRLRSLATSEVWLRSG
jgi:hypothetical protein